MLQAHIQHLAQITRGKLLLAWVHETISYLLMINEPNGPPSDWSPFTHKDKLASGRGGEAYFVIVTNFASGGGDVAYIVTNPALPLASLSLCKL